MSTGTKQTARPLTHDEKKAAEAAFRGAPFNPKWSEAARKVYQGISGAVANRPSDVFRELASQTRTLSPMSAIVERKNRSRSKTKIQ
ncbi:MAG: hypothetical protein NPIRA05_07630 [Nitrospirales bacterium]|nr:MAG: hypothetical protein NPIRA05_07630 [Nitrospirales bacterium]